MRVNVVTLTYQKKVVTMGSMSHGDRPILLIYFSREKPFCVIAFLFHSIT